MAKGCWAEDVSVNKFASRMNLEQKSDPIVPKSWNDHSQDLNPRTHVVGMHRTIRETRGPILDTIWNESKSSPLFETEACSRCE
jgi:hypothetical protein